MGSRRLHANRQDQNGVAEFIPPLPITQKEARGFVLVVKLNVNGVRCHSRYRTRTSFGSHVTIRHLGAVPNLEGVIHHREKRTGKGRFRPQADRSLSKKSPDGVQEIGMFHGVETFFPEVLRIQAQSACEPLFPASFLRSPGQEKSTEPLSPSQFFVNVSVALARSVPLSGCAAASMPNAET